jgi:hypothetical protein
MVRIALVNIHPASPVGDYDRDIVKRDMRATSDIPTRDVARLSFKD